MNLSAIFKDFGIGVMATASADGSVNTAVYARPRIINEHTLVWGMTDGLTFRNISENPHASFLFKAAAPGFSGVRIALELIRAENSGEMLAAIKKNTSEIVGPGAGLAMTHAVWFRIVDTRALI